jgi:hypothetical protein
MPSLAMTDGERIQSCRRVRVRASMTGPSMLALISA